MNHAYEDLSGAAGRSAYFRARRYRARAIMKEMAPAVVLGDAFGSLYDFSVTGMAVRMAEVPQHLSPGAVVPLSVKLNDVSAYSGRGRVVRSQSGARWTTVGVKLLDGVLDAGELKATHDRLVVKEAIARGASHFTNVPSAYRQLCGEAAFFFEYWRSNLARLEISRESQRPSADPLAEIEAEAERRMRVEWNSIRTRGNELTSGLSQDDPCYSAVKAYTEILLTPLTMGAPIWRRAYEKPLGYPGDYCLMNFMYDDARCGSTAFDRIVHQLGREEHLAATVPSRKNLLVDVIRNVDTAKSLRASRVNILSIGAGPAREIEEYLGSSPDAGPPLVFSLIDQDEEALAYACERLQRAILRCRREVEIRPRHIAFNQLLARGDLLAELSGQDMIYSAGLIDYLSDRTAQGLVVLCYQLLERDGVLAFGNALLAPDVRWVPEFILDWHMIYRREAELIGLAAALPSGARISTMSDRSSTWCFAVIERSA